VPIGKATKVTHPVVAFGFSNERRMMHGDTRIPLSLFLLSLPIPCRPPFCSYLASGTPPSIGTQPSKNNNDNNNNKNNKKKREKERD